MSEDVPGATPALDEQSPWSRGPKTEPKGRRLALVMNSASALLLAGATCAVLLSASPTLLRAMLIDGPAASVARGVETIAPQRTAAPKAEGLRFLYDDAEPEREDHAPDDLEHRFPGAVPKQPYLGPDRRDERDERDERDALEDPDRDRSSAPGGREDSPSTIRMGLARQTLKLLERPGDGAAVMGEIKAGEQVVIIKEAGPWALVFHGGSMGWTRKNEIAVR